MTRRPPDSYGAIVTYAPAAWVRQALCAQTDPELFFPPKGQPATEAKRVCNACSVKPQCLLYAINAPMALDGIWGGLTPKERQAKRRELGLGARASNLHDACGSEAGAKRHHRRREPVCAACSRAVRLARAERAERRRA